MTGKHDTTPYCSDACRATPIVRSFGRCPACGLTWDMQAQGPDRHYRNNAWLLCNTCAIEQCRCVVCGKPVA
jgi:hypothetical protein